MATLKGQNLRIIIKDGSTYKCVGMSTNCVITLTNNTEDANTKDDPIGSPKPTVTNKSWSVQVDSLNVIDTAAILENIQNMYEFDLLWYETLTTNNQTTNHQTYARTGKAYLNDVNFTFNDHTNSAKSLQFVGTGAISTTNSVTTVVQALGSYTKGQFVRLFLSANDTDDPTKVIAAAKQLTFHASMAFESATTKDTEGEWDIQVPTSLSYDITSQALVRSGDTIDMTVLTLGQGLNDIEQIYEAGTPVKWFIGNVEGKNNRELVENGVIVKGHAVLSQLVLTASNRQSAIYSAQLRGYGAYEFPTNS